MIESRTAKALKVRHLATGNGFTFRVSDRNKKPRFPARNQRRRLALVRKLDMIAVPVTKPDRPVPDTG
jgi:hypothetical protein